MVDSGTYETVPIIRIPDAYPELMAFSHSGLAFQVNHTGLSYQVDGVRCSLIFTQAEGSTLGFQEEYHWSYHICELFLSTAQEQRHF